MAALSGITLVSGTLDPTATALMVIGGGLVVAFVFQWINRRRRQRSGESASTPEITEIDDPLRMTDSPEPRGSAETEADLTPRQRHERRQQGRGLNRDLEAMAVEIEALAKRLTAQVEDHSLRLEKLIEDADRSIGRLEELQTKLAALPPIQRTGETVPQGAAQLDALETDLPAGNPNPVPVVTISGSNPRPPYEPDDPLARNVYQLADTGLQPLEIARRLDEHVGKIELILALREV